MSAPSCERMTSSTACRTGVPGAIVLIAASSWVSRRGSSSDGVRVNPRSVCDLVISLWSLCGIERGLDRVAQRVHLGHAQFATSRRAARSDDPVEAELRAFLEAPLGLRRLAEASREPDLAE